MSEEEVAPRGKTASSSENLAAATSPHHHHHHRRRHRPKHPPNQPQATTTTTVDPRRHPPRRHRRSHPRSSDYSPPISFAVSSQNTEEEEGSQTTSGSSHSGSGSCSGSSYDDSQSQSTSGEEGEDDSGSVTSGSGSDDDEEDSLHSSSTRSSASSASSNSIESPMISPSTTRGTLTGEEENGHDDEHHQLSTFSTLSPVEGPLSTFGEDDDIGFDSDHAGGGKVGGEAAAARTRSRTTRQQEDRQQQQKQQQQQPEQPQPNLNLPVLESTTRALSPGSAAAVLLGNTTNTAPASPLLTTNSPLTTLISADSIRPVRVSVSETRPSIPVAQQQQQQQQHASSSSPSSQKSSSSFMNIKNKRKKKKEAAAAAVARGTTSPGASSTTSAAGGGGGGVETSLLAVSPVVSSTTIASGSMPGGSSSSSPVKNQRPPPLSPPKNKSIGTTTTNQEALTPTPNKDAVWVSLAPPALSSSTTSTQEREQQKDEAITATTASLTSPLEDKVMISPTATTVSSTTVVTGTATRHRQRQSQKKERQHRNQYDEEEATTSANNSDDLGTASSDTTQPTSPGRNPKSRQQKQLQQQEQEQNSTVPKVDAEGLLAALAPPLLIRQDNNKKDQKVSSNSSNNNKDLDNNNSKKNSNKMAQEDPPQDSDDRKQDKVVDSNSGGGGLEKVVQNKKDPVDAELTPVPAPALGGTGTATTANTSSSNSARKQPQLHIHTGVDNNLKQEPEDDLQQAPTLSFPQVSTQGSSPGRSRIPGGAAAKLIFVRPHTDDDGDDSCEQQLSNTQVDGEQGGRQVQGSINLAGKGGGEGGSVDMKPTNSDETYEDSIKLIELTLKLAKQEFELGSPSNRRYHQTVDEDDAENGEEDAPNDEASSYTPNFLNRSEIFFDSASAAIAALLTPRAAAEATASSTKNNNYSNGGGETTRLPKTPSSTTSSAFQTPDETSGFKFDQSYLSFGRRDVSENLLKPQTERKIEELTKRMHDPTKTLTDLLTAIATPEHKHQMDLGFMVRRKNACGALKVLTNEPKKRLRICWTVGVLPALTSVLADAARDGLMATFPDKRIREEYEAARNRAIATLLNLSAPKPNRIPVFHTPDLVQSLLAIIMDDNGEAQKGCTAILAYLSKTVENRLLIVKVPGFFPGVVSVLKPLPPPPHKTEVSGPIKKHPWSAIGSPDEESESHSKRKLNDEDSDRTPVVMPSKSSVENSVYDQTADELLRTSRQNIFAVMNHVGKEKDNTYHITRDSSIINTLIDVSAFQDSPAHTIAIKFIANLTRHRLNTKRLVFQERRTVPALVRAANSPSDETRLYACYAIQNMSQDKACRQELAVFDGLISTLCHRGRYASDDDERLAAISTLKNLCDEPANLIPLTNTPACIATLMHLAHGKEDGVTEMMQYRACDALATLSHWLRKIATSGKNLDAGQRGLKPETTLFVPSLRVVTWNQWE